MRLLAIVTLAAAAAAQTYTYDAAGRLTRVTWPNGRAILYAYDAADNMLSAVPVSVPPAPAATSAREVSSGANRISWAARDGAPTSWTLQRRAPGGDWQTIATLTGTATSFEDSGAPAGAEYRVAAGGASGNSAWSRTFRASSAASVDLEVPRYGAGQLVTSGSMPGVNGGYVTVDVESGSVPFGSAIFSLVQNGVLITEAAVPASPPSRRSLVTIEYRQDVTAAAGQFQGSVRSSTGIGMTNPGTRSVALDFTLRDRDGRVAATARGSLGAGAHAAHLIEDLQAIAPGFSVPESFAASGVGTLEVASASPVSVMALRATFNQRGEVLFTSTPVADLSTDVSPGPVVFPHFAEGGGYTTAITLANPGEAELTGTLQFYGSDGSPAQIATVGGTVSSAIAYRVPARGATLIETAGAGEVRSGWARVVPDGGQTAPSGAIVFRLGQNGVVVGEAGVPASIPSVRQRIWVDRREGRNTGAAIANPAAATATLRIRAFRADGVTPVTDVRTLNLPANGHIAALSDDLAGSLPPEFFGVVEIESPTPVAALSLRFRANSRDELVFSTLPVADLTRPAPWPLIFPHIAEGGGFVTELIFLSPQTAARIRAGLFDDFGQPLPAAVVP